MICSIKKLLLGVSVLMLSTQIASADLVLDLRFKDVVGTSLNVNSGQSFFVEMLITDTNNSTPLMAEGLLSAGGRIIQSSGGAVLSSIATVVNPGDLLNPGFESANLNPMTVPPQIAAFLAAADPFLPLGVGAGTSSVLLATFELQATGAGGSTANIMAALLGLHSVTNSPLIGNITFGHFDGLGDPVDGLELDGLFTQFNSVNVTINSTPVPEPASMLLGGLTAAFAGVAAWKKRKTASVLNPDAKV